MADALDKLDNNKQGGQQSGPDVGSILRLVRKHKWMILGISLAVPTIVGVVTSKQTKIYQASVSIVIEMTVPQYLGTGFRDVVEMESNWWSSRENLETEFRVLRSESQAVNVARVLCDRKLATFGNQPALKYLVPTTTCTNPNDFLVGGRILQGVLRVEPIKDSRIVMISTQSSNAELAALLANTYATVYLERNLDRRLSHSNNAASWLGSQYGELAVQLREAEQALVDFKRKNNIVAVNLEDNQNDLSTRRKAISQKLTEIEVELVTLRAQREMFAALRKVNADPIADFNPDMINSEVARKLKELYLDQYIKLLELRSKYLEKHPLVLGAEARVHAIKSDLTREIELSNKNIDTRYDMLVKQAGDLRSALRATTQEALELEARASEYNRLKRTLERFVRLADQVGGREQETSLATHLKTNNVRILDPARVPTAPISPDVPRAVGVAIVIGLLLAFGIAVLVQSFDNTIKSQEDLERTVGLSFLGLIPSISVDQKNLPPALATGENPKNGTPASKDIYVWLNPKSSVAECCRSIRTNLLFMTPDRPARTLLITSASPQEGKTTVAVNLAISLAQSGLSVLLVDTDMRRPRLHKAFGIPSSEDGLSKAVVGECDVFSVVRETVVPNLSLLPCGACPPNPAELLHSERFKRIIADLSARYDRVIFDSPPIAAVTDPVILARLTDGTVFVAKAGRTGRDTLAQARRQLTVDGRVNILGCIINDLDMSKQGRYGYYDYYYYYSRYGEYYAADDRAKPVPSA